MDMNEQETNEHIFNSFTCSHKLCKCGNFLQVFCCRIESQLVELEFTKFECMRMKIPFCGCQSKFEILTFVYYYVWLTCHRAYVHGDIPSLCNDDRPMAGAVQYTAHKSQFCKDDERSKTLTTHSEYFVKPYKSNYTKTTNIAQNGKQIRDINIYQANTYLHVLKESNKQDNEKVFMKELKQDSENKCDVELKPSVCSNI